MGQQFHSGASEWNCYPFKVELQNSEKVILERESFSQKFRQNVVFISDHRWTSLEDQPIELHFNRPLPGKEVYNFNVSLMYRKHETKLFFQDLHFHYFSVWSCEGFLQSSACGWNGTGNETVVFGATETFSRSFTWSYLSKCPIKVPTVTVSSPQSTLFLPSEVVKFMKWEPWKY